MQNHRDGFSYLKHRVSENRVTLFGIMLSGLIQLRCISPFVVAYGSMIFSENRVTLFGIML